MDTHDTLHAYSEWLDTQNVLSEPSEKDKRAHDDLVKEFIAHWEDDSGRVPLAGKGPLLGYATTKELIDELAARAHVSNVIGEDWPTYRTVDSE